MRDITTARGIAAATIFFVGMLLIPHFSVAALSTPPKMIGMYVHEHWPYKYPYAARTWSLEDWRGYAIGLKSIGYNTVLIWPMLETMPNPLTASDESSLDNDARVIDMLHEIGLRAFIVLSPNVVAGPSAADASFEARHFYWSNNFVDPKNAKSVRQMIEWRKQLLGRLKALDGIAIIDSDPGGDPGASPNDEEFVSLLKAHREMLDGLRPGIEMLYWMHLGWRAWSEFQLTGKFEYASKADQVRTLSRLKELNPKPWAIANGLPTNWPSIKESGLESNTLAFQYGIIEEEPSLPMTNFGGNAAYEAGANTGAKGVIGSAQTHCIQLPNTFAFVRGALGRPLADSDYVQFADQLIRNRGRMIFGAWQALGGHDPEIMRDYAKALHRVEDGPLQAGDLQGLLFGSPRRFLQDLELELELRAVYERFLKASKDQINVEPAFAAFVMAADSWQQRTGFQGLWLWADLIDALYRLHSPEIEQVLGDLPENFARVGFAKDGICSRRRCLSLADFFQRTEIFTPNLILAMKSRVEMMRVDTTVAHVSAHDDRKN